MIAVSSEPVTNYYGKILGYLETDSHGNQQVRNFYGQILGYYDVSTNLTTNFYGIKLTEGNTVVGLLYK